MNFSDIFWTTLKMRMAVSIQDAIIDSATRQRFANNNQDILKELLEIGDNFNSLLAKHRNLIKVEKALQELNTMDQFTNDQKEIINNELLRIKINLENI